MTKATAIGFFRHSSDMTTSKEMVSFYNKLLGIFQNFGVKPEGSDAPGYDSFMSASFVLGQKPKRFISLSLFMNRI